MTDKKLFLTRLSSAPYLLEIRVLEPFSAAQTDRQTAQLIELASPSANLGPKAPNSTRIIPP